MSTQKQPWVLGLSASHNGAACLLHGHDIVAAIQEERLVGKKRARLQGANPSLAIQYCLAQGGIGVAELDMVVLCAQSALSLPENDLNKNALLKIQQHGTPTLSISHHAGHAIGAFATSGFDEAAVLVIDGMGSPTQDLSDDEKRAIIDGHPNGGETNSIYFANGTKLTALEKHMIAEGLWLKPPATQVGMPGFGSLGGIFSAASEQIFGSAMDAGKVMGLAPYGKATIPPEEFFEIKDGQFLFSNEVPRRFIKQERWPTDRENYENLAASVQNALEQALLYLVDRTRALCSSRNLAYAGGVALNSVANERIVRECDFDHVYFMPAAEDSGPAIGAAYHGLWHLTGEYLAKRQERDGLGKTYTGTEISSTIAQTPAITSEESIDTIDTAVKLLQEGKIIAWFTGPSELGPRSLGQRSILCDPRQANAKEQLNARVKHREGFRPFAPVIPLEEVGNWFEVGESDPESPFMLRVMRFREEKAGLVPAVVHVDGTGRVQTVKQDINGSYYRLVKTFGEQTGVPVLLNTSLNVMGEPIVETPEDALWCLLLTDLDACVFDNAIVRKKPAYTSLTELIPYLRLEPKDIRRTASGDGLLFAVATPWGHHVIGLREQPLVNILEFFLSGVMDGASRAATIFERVRSQFGNMSDSELIRLLAQLRRWRLIAFKEAA